MMRLMFLCTGILSCSVDAFELQPYTATYQFNLDNKLTGTATRVLTRQENQYHYQFSAQAMIASATETSDFSFDGKQVQSQHYENSKQILFKNKTASVDFDWSKQQATTRRNGENSSYALTTANVLDPLNLEIQIRQDLLDKAKNALDSEYVLADAKGMGPLKFTLDGNEKITTPYGEIETVKVTRVHLSADRKTEFWLAKSLNYLPVKVVQMDDGAMYTIELQSYQEGRSQDSQPAVSSGVNQPIAPRDPVAGS